MDKDTANTLKSIADKLDVPLENLWNGLIAYAPFEFYEWVAIVVSTGLGIVAGIAMIALGIYRSNKPNAKTDDGAATSFTGLVMFIIMFGTFLIGGLGSTAYALSAHYAPEAWAAKYILQKVR